MADVEAIAIGAASAVVSAVLSGLAAWFKARAVYSAVRQKGADQRVESMWALEAEERAHARARDAKLIDTLLAEREHMENELRGCRNAFDTERRENLRAHLRIERLEADRK